MGLCRLHEANKKIRKKPQSSFIYLFACMFFVSAKFIREESKSEFLKVGLRSVVLAVGT